MDYKELNLSIEEFRDRENQTLTATFEDLIERLQNCDWEWHNKNPEDEDFAAAKASYESVVSCMDALRARYFDDPVMLAKIKKTHNEYSPSKYDIP